jgi:hypothetical protein
MLQELTEIITQTEVIIAKLKQLQAACGELKAEACNSPWKEVSPEDHEADWRDGETANDPHE